MTATCVRCHVNEHPADFIHQYEYVLHPKKDDTRIRWDGTALVETRATYARCIHCRNWAWANTGSVCPTRVAEHAHG